MFLAALEIHVSYTSASIIIIFTIKASSLVLPLECVFYLCQAPPDWQIGFQMASLEIIHRGQEIACTVRCTGIFKKVQGASLKNHCELSYSWTCLSI